MYVCERCGTKFGRPPAVLESCPRCLARDGVRVTLTFRLLAEEGTATGPGPARTDGLEAAVRETLAATASGRRRAPARGGLRGAA